MKKQSLLLASDLDRTILPNGFDEESNNARPLLRRLSQREEVCLVYVSGRNKNLLTEAVEGYQIPIPKYAIGDVGTTIYEGKNPFEWVPIEAWQEKISSDWKGKSWEDVKRLFDKIDDIKLQEEEMQNTFKVSYYTKDDIDKKPLLLMMQEIAGEAGIDASFIWSVDEAKKTGLLDVLPRYATKLHALEFLKDEIVKIPSENTVFSGDSGNDIPALTSGLNAVMVRNTRSDVVDEVMAIAKEKGIDKKIYLAKGDFLGMNGNYSAGVLEGIAHFFPQIIDWIS